jgi:hypothetical protein
MGGAPNSSPNRVILGARRRRQEDVDLPAFPRTVTVAGLASLRPVRLGSAGADSNLGPSAMPGSRNMWSPAEAPRNLGVCPAIREGLRDDVI